jgi:hypothetical protein
MDIEIEWEDKKCLPEFQCRNLLESNRLEDTEGDGTITLTWTLGRWVVRRGGGQKWAKIVSNSMFDIISVEPSLNTTRKLVT